MPSTLQAVLAIALAVLPGAVYLWGFEREAGKWGIGVSDTLLRFVAASAVFLALYAAPLYQLYEHYVHHRVTHGERVAFTNPLEDGNAPWWLGLVPVAYVGLPAVLGTLVGRSVRSDRPGPKAFARVMAGRNPAPRGWDDLFVGRPAGTVRLRLKQDGSWVGGAFGEGSYASGYPEEPQDLLLEQTYQMELDGSFAQDGEDFVKIGSKLLVRFDEVDILEFFPAD